MVSTRTRILAAGTFDGIHAGHRAYLRAAKALGGTLTVIVARDATVVRLKGKRPRRTERQRLAAIAKLPEVDRAVLGLPVRTAREGERFRLLLRLRPDIICLGYDQPVHVRPLQRFLSTHGLAKTCILRLPHFRAPAKRVPPRTLIARRPPSRRIA